MQRRLILSCLLLASQSMAQPFVSVRFSEGNTHKILPEIMYSGMRKASEKMGIDIIFPWEKRAALDSKPITIDVNDEKFANQEEGRSLASSLALRYNLNKETLVLVFSRSGDLASMRRRQAVNAYLQKTGIPHIDYPLSRAFDRDPYLARPIMESHLTTNPSTKAIIIDHPALQTQLISVLKNLAKKPGEVIVAGFQLNHPTIMQIQAGWVQHIIDPSPYLKGYTMVVNAYLANKDAQKLAWLKAAPLVVSPHNITILAGVKRNGLY